MRDDRHKRNGCVSLWLVALALLLMGFTVATAKEGGAIEQSGAISAGKDASLMINGIQVVIDGSFAEEEKKSYAHMARQLIRVRVGETLDEAALQASIEALKFSNRFSAVHVDSITQAGGETLLFNLTPYLTIAEIDIEGKYPLFEREVLNQMTIYPGNPYTPQQLSDQTGAVVQEYKRAGYIDPQVAITEWRQPGEQQGIIQVDIAKGPHYILGELRFLGNDHISTIALKLRMSVWRADLMPFFGRFSEYWLKKDMTSLRNYYYSKGFADVEISYGLARPGDGVQTDVTVQIKEGPRSTVDLVGNEEFWDRTLKKDLVLFSGGNHNNVGIRKSIRNIKKRYHEAGYLATKVTIDTCPGAEKTQQLHPLCVVIDEGPQTLVDQVVVVGNDHIDDEKIKEQMLTRPPSLLHDGAYLPETLDTDVYAVSTLYQNQGFTKREVGSEVRISDDKSGADVLLEIDEGPQTRVRSIAFYGLSVVPEEAARKMLVHHPGDPYQKAASEVEKEAITDLIAEKGYPHATVQASISYSADHTQADIVYDVTPGPLVTLGEVFISGNLRTDEKIILQELEIEPDSPLSLQALYDAQRRLRDMEIFHGVTYRTFGLKEQADRVDLFIEVEENKPYYAQGGIGYESDTGFFSRIKGGDRNLFGLNKELWAAAQVSETGYRLESQFREPRFFGSRISSTIGVFAEELTEFNQSFGTRSLGGSVGFNYLWGQHLTTAVSFSLERRTQFSVDAPVGEAIDEEPRTVFVTTPSLVYDTRDSFVRPTKGLLSSLMVDISKGAEAELDDFIRYDFDTRYYWTPWQKLTFAGRARVAQVFSYSDSELVPEDQLFYLGGIQSVRGYAENLLRFDDKGDPVGGKTAMTGSLEARIDLGYNLELATFYDIGTVQESLVAEGLDTFRSSVGLGLRYITPIGPIGLVYGHKLDPQDGESSGRIHFSIGYSF